MDNPPRITWRGGQLRAIKAKHFRHYTVSGAHNSNNLAVGQARKEIIEFILVYQHLRALSLSQAIRTIQGRIDQRKIPPHLIDAVLIANALPNRIGSITISSRTLFRWARAYKHSNGDATALAPRSSKALYANDNAPLRTK